LPYRILRRQMTSSIIGVPNPLPATFLRGGTSKGIFIDQKLLPQSQSEWNQIFLGIMGSPDPEYGRQLNGMGGGVSSLSKIVLVKPVEDDSLKSQGVHVEYTFIQVGIRDDTIDISGNCGNLSSVVGVFAMDEGMVPLEESDGVVWKDKAGNFHATVRAFNTNTSKIIETTFPVALERDSTPSPDLSLSETGIAGVPGTASKIVLDFLNPGGARTGKLLPTGETQTTLEIIPDDQSGSRSYRSSLVDATNPSVFVDASELGFAFSEYISNASTTGARQISETLEKLRRAGAQKMGLDPSAQAQPKIAVLSHAESEDDMKDEVDIVVHALSMGVLHKAVPMTLGLCLGVTANIKGTLAWELVRRSRDRRAELRSASTAASASQGDGEGLLRIRHPSGVVDVGAEFGTDGSVKSAKVVRTGRRLMKGVVYW